MMLDSRVVVGPIGRGDAGPCLVCAEFYLLDSDSALHSLAAALPDGPAAPDSVVIAAGSCAAAVLIRALAGAPLPPGVVTSPPQAGATVTVDPFGPVPVRTDHLRVHPRCPVCADAMGGTSA